MILGYGWLSRIRIRTYRSNSHRFYTETKGRVDQRQLVSPASSPPTALAAHFTSAPAPIPVSKVSAMETISRARLGSVVMASWEWNRAQLFPGDQGSLNGRPTGCAHLQILHQELRRSPMFHRENVCQLSIWLHPRWHKHLITVLGLQPSESNRYDFFFSLNKDALRIFVLTREPESLLYT